MHLILGVLLLSLFQNPLLDGRKISENYLFDSPDLVASISTGDKGQNVILEGFKTLENDQILVENNTNLFPQLFWVSLGYPQLIRTRYLPELNYSRISENSTRLNITFKHQPRKFHYNSEGFYTHMQFLTDPQKEALAQTAIFKYGLKSISSSQIGQLIPTDSKCQFVLNNHETQTTILIDGNIQSFRHQPTRIYFTAPVGTINREIFFRNYAELENV